MTLRNRFVGFPNQIDWFIKKNDSFIVLVLSSNWLVTIVLTAQWRGSYRWLRIKTFQSVTCTKLFMVGWIPFGINCNDDYYHMRNRHLMNAAAFWILSNAFSWSASLKATIVLIIIKQTSTFYQAQVHKCVIMCRMHTLSELITTELWIVDRTVNHQRLWFVRKVIHLSSKRRADILQFSP